MRATWAWLAAGSMLATQAFAAAPVARPSVIADPEILSRPTSDEMAAVYPEVAQALNLDGAAKISCRLEAKGVLTDCEVVDETPRGFGFGAAAIAAATYFRIRPRMVDGQPVDGGVIRMPLNFTMPRDEETGPRPRPTSAAALALAPQLVAAMGLVEQANATSEREAKELEYTASHSPADLVGPVAAALRKAQAAHQADFKADLALAVASVLTEPEIRQAIAFMASPGAAVINGNDEIKSVYAMVNRSSGAYLLQAAHEAFCEQRDCTIPQTPPDTPPNTITTPRWSVAPTPAEVLRVTNPASLALGLEGRAQLLCKATSSATIVDCKVLSEAPKGLKFGQAALALAPVYRLAAGATAGAPVLVAVDFRLPDLPETFTGPAPRSAQSLALAKQMRGADAADARLSEADLAQFTANIDPADRPAVVEALQIGARAAIQRSSDVMAAANTVSFTDDQLAAALQFQTSAFIRKSESLDKAVASAANRHLQAVTKEARAEVCRTYDCTPSAPKIAAQPIAASPAASTRTP